MELRSELKSLERFSFLLIFELRQGFVLSFPRCLGFIFGAFGFLDTFHIFAMT